MRLGDPKQKPRLTSSVSHLNLKNRSGDFPGTARQGWRSRFSWRMNG